MLALQETWVWSLLGELRSHMLRGVTKQTNEKATAKKKKRNEKEKPEQENKRERKCVLYILVYTKWEAKKKSMKKDL